MIGRISTFSEVNYLMSIDNTIQAQEAAANTQEASGLQAQTYGGLGGSTTSLVLHIANQVSQLKSSESSATTVLSDMQETNSVMGEISNLGTTILSGLSGDISGGSSDSSSVASTASTWMNQLTSLLNTEYGGGYVFSGTATDTAPVDTSSSSYDPTADPTTADTGYYQGSSSGTTFYGADGFSVSTSVQADNPGFEKMLRGLSMVAADPANQSTLTQAYSLIQQGVAEVNDAQAGLSANSSALSQYQSGVSTQVATLTSLSSSFEGADLASATVMVTDLSNQLTASYETVSKLMSDSLAKVLGG